MNYLQHLFPIRNNNFNREPAPKANVSGLKRKERGIAIFAWFLEFRSQRSRFCSAPKANVLGLTLKERGIVIFAWFLAYLSELKVSFLHRAQLKKRGIVIFAWFLAYFRRQRSRFCTAPKANVLGLTRKERGIVIFVWFLEYLSESKVSFLHRAA